MIIQFRMLMSAIKPGLFFICIFSFLSISVTGQSVNNNWQKELDQALSAYKQCSESATEKETQCANAAGEVLKTVYRLNDFYLKSDERYMVVREVADYLGKDKKWELIGHAYEQNALDRAQELANKKHAVVAVFPGNTDDGHVSVILPGNTLASGTWGLKVPNSASFFVHAPQKSYVGKALSYAFTRGMIKDVLIFARNY